MILGVALVRANVWASSNREGSKKPLSHTERSLRSAPRVRQYAGRTSAHTAPDRRHIRHLVTPRYHEERETHSARYIYTFATRRSAAFLRTPTPIQRVARSLCLPRISPMDTICHLLAWPVDIQV